MIFIREKRNFIKLYEEHVKRYPKLQADDIYKYVYQSTFGVGHFVNDEKQAEEQLKIEILNMENISFEEPMIEMIDVETNLARVNLRPYKGKNENLNKLVKAMIETAKEVKGSQDIMENKIRQVLKVFINAPIYKETKNLFDEMKKKGYPAVHHSQTYKNEYKPAYRIVQLKYL